MSIVDILKTGGTRDVVGIWDSTYKQVFVHSRPMNIMIGESSKNMEHPLETGSVVIDHRIILPVTIDMVLLMDGAYYYDQYLKLKKSFLAGELFYIHTRTGIFPNMMFVDIPHEENAAKYDTIEVPVKMLEVKFVEPQFAPLPESKVKEPTNQSTKNKGISSAATPSAGSEATVKRTSAAKQVKNYFSGGA